LSISSSLLRLSSSIFSFSSIFWAGSLIGFSIFTSGIFSISFSVIIFSSGFFGISSSIGASSIFQV